MSKVLIIAEKPSVAKSIGNVVGAYQEKDGYLEGGDWLVSWCLGHLVEFALPVAYDEKYAEWNLENLPIIPDNWKMNVPKDKKTQYAAVKELMSRSDVGYVINACDAGREGELIFRRVYDLAGCRLPVMRLWISSLEDKAIREGLQNMMPASEYDNLAAASACRAQADWLIGMNDSRAFTTTYGRKLILGRVQTPTLAMITEREAAIDSFQKEQYFLVHLRKDGLDAVSEKFADRSQAEQIASACSGQDACVTSVSREEKKTAPPKLYDLTTLQREANRLFGMTASKTLETAQSLYEAKLITYPRTDSRYLTEDMEDTVSTVIEHIYVSVPFVGSTMLPADVTRVMDNRKVSDHHAIIPTVEIRDLDFGSLSDNDRRVLFLIITRLLCATGKTHRYTLTKATIECSGTDFSAQTRHVDEAGWKSFEESMKAYCKTDAPEDAGKEVETFLPEVQEGTVLPAVESAVTEHWTKPPQHFSEDSLLSAMERAGAKEMDDGVERKGLGTPATRASMIEKLITSGYIVRKSKKLLPTDKGKLLISLVPEYLKSASMTAEWENRLLAMEHGEDDPKKFMEDIIAQIMYTLEECRNIPEEVRARYRAQEEKKREPVGRCPICHSRVYEGPRVFFCEDEHCSFCLWKENRYLERMRKTLTHDMAVDLLEDGRTFVRGLYSRKKDKTFSADLVMEIRDNRPHFSLDFPKGRGKR